MQKISRPARLWLRGVSFLLAALMLLYGAGNLLRDRSTTLSCLYSEPDDSLDVLVVGSSHVNCGYMPSILWQEHNISACNVYSWSQPIWIAYYYIREALRTQHPQTVVLELFGMTYGHSSLMPAEIDKSSYANSFTIDDTPNFLAMIQTVRTCGLDLRDPADFLNLPRYHSRWKQPSLSMLTYNPHHDHDPLKGYGLTYASAPQTDPCLTASEPYAPYETCVIYLDKIVALCQSRGINLVFTLTPYVYTQDEAGIFLWLQDYADAHGIPFLNYNGADGARVGIDYTADFSDWGHLNYGGARKVTEDLSAFLAASYSYPTRQQHSNAAQLDSDLLQFERVLQVQNALTAPTLSSWLTQALGDENFSVFAADTGADSAASAALRSAFSAAGLAPPATFSTAAVLGGSAQYDAASLPFALFGKTGTITLNAAGIGADGQPAAEVLLNGTTAPASGTALTLVLYDNVLNKPLETVTVETGEGAADALHHREFTSDLLPLYKK